MNRVLVVLLSGMVTAGDVDADERLSGGATTVFNEGRSAFELPLANISRSNRRAHVVGNSFFNKNWVIAPASTAVRDGLGPVFHARSCSGCHTRDGRAAPPGPDELMTGLLFRLSIPGKGSHGEPVPDPVYGGQLGVRAIPGAEPEGDVEITYTERAATFADGTPYSLREPAYELRTSGAYPAAHPDVMMGPRIAPPVMGLGLLEAVPETDLLARSDPQDADADGISGRPNYVWDSERGERRLGRIGWKAGQPDLRQQTASAFLGDIGITSPVRPEEDYTAAQAEALGSFPTGGRPEIDEKLLGRVVTYLQTLAPPARRGVEEEMVVRGKELFLKAKCAVCHVPEMKTGPFPAVPELGHQVIRPYTDLLLHDMGEGLADGRPDFEATGNEWRTPPLWGIGLTEAVNGHTYFLHDGRARNLQEAILWHGGEAEASKEHFRTMPREDREAILGFLESL